MTKTKKKRPSVLHTTLVDGVYMCASAIKEREEHAAYMKQKEIEDRKKRKSESMRTMSLADYRIVRSEAVYYSEKATKLKNFWTKNQERLLKEFYLKLTKKVCPMKNLCVESLGTSPCYQEMLVITRKMGLHHLMQLEQRYNLKVIQQFFATVYICNHLNIKWYWMTGDKPYKAEFDRFAKVLGYPYRGKEFASGTRIHSQGIEADKKLLKPLTIAGGTPGLTKDLLPLYDILLRVFRSSISPCGGNTDVVRGALVNLLVHAYKVAQCEEICEHDHRIDVMDYIHEELYGAIMNRKCPPYAPFIMMRICNVVQDQGDLLANAKVSTTGRIIKKVAHSTPADGPSRQPPARASAKSKGKAPHAEEDDVTNLTGEQKLIFAGCCSPIFLVITSIF